jgi:hypothetical protein
MKLNEETKDRVLKFLEEFPINIGKNLFFREAICTDKENFDRHLTSYSSTEFKLTNFATRFSGARIMFDGEKLNYEISLDYLIKIERHANEIIFLEAYSEKIYRRTIMAISDEGN